MLIECAEINHTRVRARERRLKIAQINCELVEATKCAEDEIKSGHAHRAEARLEAAISEAEKMRIKSTAAMDAREVQQQLRARLRGPDDAKPVARTSAPKSNARPSVTSTHHSPLQERSAQRAAPSVARLTAKNSASVTAESPIVGAAHVPPPHRPSPCRHRQTRTCVRACVRAALLCVPHSSVIPRGLGGLLRSRLCRSSSR